MCCSVLTMRTPEPLTVPPITLSPGALDTGSDSPAHTYTCTCVGHAVGMAEMCGSQTLYRPGFDTGRNRRHGAPALGNQSSALQPLLCHAAIDRHDNASAPQASAVAVRSRKRIPGSYHTSM